MKVMLSIDEIGHILATHVAKTYDWQGALNIVNVWTLDAKGQIESVTIERKEGAASSPAQQPPTPGATDGA